MAKSYSHFDFKAVGHEVEQLCDEEEVDLGEDCLLSGKPLGDGYTIRVVVTTC